MKLKSKALHFEINSYGSKPSGYIRNSYRENGTVKHETISRINGCTLEQLQAMKAGFDGKSVEIEDIEITGGREYGMSRLLYDLAVKSGLPSLIYSRCELWVKCALAMIIGRIVYQGSKLSLSKVSDYSCLWEICGINGDIDVDKHCYSAMDELLARQQSIQKKLARQRLNGGSIVLYDITSSYLEGEYSDANIVDYGYNRDKKRGKKQIVIGLVCASDGCPVAVEVFRGNTNDSATVCGKISEIRKTYGVTDVIFVGDRGMLTQKNIDANPDILTVTALTHSAIRQLCEEENVQLSLFDENTSTEVILPEEPSVRYALRKNPIRAERDRNKRLAIIAATEEQLAEIAVPKRKTTDEKLGARVGKVFSKLQSQKYFIWKVEDGKVLYSCNAIKVAEEERYDGLYVIRSNVPADKMTIHEVVDTYKKLINVEQAFRQMKTVELELRPIYHRTESRIKSHVFICMLSYYLLWNLRQQLGSNLCGEEYSLDQVIEIMKAQQQSTLTVRGISSTVIAKPTNKQLSIITSALKQ